ncbi:hypothetical protein [Acidiphilium sp. C61]|jgi:hypothetical protein|uniref:hypothetical protein n=1 Tax=Acidiphilium sp. C61 TaxID=1671485 RepID=UPI00157B0135|nr:hypothetical protein [Acidiphilium sp. C61]
MNGEDRFAGALFSTLRGIFRLALGRLDAFREFGNTPAAFSASIAPLIAFPMVGAALLAARGHWIYAAGLMLSRLCGVLIQPVIIERASQWLGRRDRWLITATALNWSIWVVFVLIPLGMVVNDILLALGAGQVGALTLSGGLIALYMLWLQGFVLRAGLQTSWWKALGLLFVVNLSTAALYAVPYVFHPGLLSLTLRPASG